jgi:hypothetical protein
MAPLRLDLTDERMLADVRMRRPLDEALAARLSPACSSREAEESVVDEEEDAPSPASPSRSPWSDSH